MRRILSGLLVLVVVVAIAALYYWSQSPAAPSSSLPVEPGSEVEPAPVVEPAETPPMPASAQPATIDYVHDGDTLFLTDGTKVRLLAVDTPEVGEQDECYGDEATAFTRALLPEGSTVYTLADVSPTDQYGRSLLFIWTSSGELVNYSLVASGYAEAVFIGQNRLYEDEFEAAEDAAVDAGVGVWGSC